MEFELGTPDNDEPIGAVLARMRRAKSLTGAELASRVGMSQPKISRIERGKGLPDLTDIAHIARALGADEEHVRALVQHAERSHGKMTDWRPALTGFAGQQKTIGEWESAAAVVKAFEPSLLPGALQTSGYAKSVFQAFQRIAPFSPEEMTDAALLAAVSARIKRQEALADPSRFFHFIVGEAALRRRTYPPAEMLAQINHIREVSARHANVSILVVPDGAPAALPLLHGFTLVDDQLVIVDLYNTGLISRSRGDLESYRRVFEALEEHATSIDSILDEYEGLYIAMLRNATGKP